ncbi:hypothetical protein DVA86_18675 [Streptomyces armeniacus]|uniref:Mycofactocin biosynthesis chaperone MftB n=1 Tax=Streptomyces armeniacus TaxID=83291 RepID=A0A345XRV5_9ACTN|nr:actinodefensin-associated protein B [Streptomyces armeniacus]AXK34371.1 hypothetical protein DVA86_18675 [Streptomyces armeniacus]
MSETRGVREPRDRELRLAGHVRFRELPFCGVLLDTEKSQVHRLSPRAARVLRERLYGAGSTGPYASLITDEPADERTAEAIVTALERAGFVHRA